MSYNEFKLKGFAAFRRWFNRFFSLSLDGKFVGLLRLGKSLDVFVNKLDRMLNKRSAHSCPLGDVISFRLSGHTIKLYNR